MLGDTRARITPVDVVMFAATLAALGFLIAPMLTIVNNNAHHLSTPTGYLFAMIPPALLMTLLIVIWKTAVGGNA